MAEYEVAYQRYEYDPSPTNFVSDCTCVVVNVQSSSMWHCDYKPMLNHKSIQLKIDFGLHYRFSN
jgi:hypothetical protein